MRLLLATTNKGKLRELERILQGQGHQLVGLDSDGTFTAPEETGSSFVENALIKARYYHRMFGVPTIADDSGLEVDALGGAPGVMSARYGGSTASDADRVQKLLEALEGVTPDRRGARFLCAAALVWRCGERVFTGEVRGTVLTHPPGQGGFGYDPVFYFRPLGKTFAELAPEEKERVSHRGIAFRALAHWLSEVHEREPDLLDTKRCSDRIEILQLGPLLSPKRGD